MDKISIRPQILTAKIEAETQPSERFQNETLRPILKMQHELLLKMCNFYLDKKKETYRNLAENQRPEFVQNNIFKDLKIQHELRGIVIGQFTVEEYKTYILNRNEFNRRIKQMLKERILSAGTEFLT